MMSDRLPVAHCSIDMIAHQSRILKSCLQVSRRPHGADSLKVGRGQNRSESVTIPKTFRLWVKPVVRWVFAAAAAGTVAWSVLAHAAKQRAQREQEATHARCHTQRLHDQAFP